jgi:hypothetical protein
LESSWTAGDKELYKQIDGIYDLLFQYWNAFLELVHAITLFKKKIYIYYPLSAILSVGGKYKWLL